MNKKPVYWCGDSLLVVRSFPGAVRRQMGLALQIAQEGGKAPSAKPMQGFKGASVLEIIEPYAGDTYRLVYTVKIAGVVCVLSAFQKKSKRGVATPKHEIALVRQRLASASANLAARKEQDRKDRKKRSNRHAPKNGHNRIQARKR